MRSPKSKVKRITTSPNTFSWALAISEAERLIQEEQGRIKRLRRSVKIFREMEKQGATIAGAVFPGVKQGESGG